MKNYLILFAFILLFGCKKEGAENLPKACFDYTASDYSGSSNLINFKNCSENASTYRWDFGDGQSSKEASPLNLYRNSGNYKVILYATGGNSTDTLFRTITIPLSVMYVGVNQPNAIEVDFSPLFIEFPNSATPMSVNLSIDGVDYLKFSRYYVLNSSTNQKVFYQKVATLNGCEICTREFKPAIFERPDNVSINATSGILNGSDLRTKPGSGNYLVFKFGKGGNVYMGWLNLNDNYPRLEFLKCNYYEIEL